MAFVAHICQYKYDVLKCGFYVWSLPIHDTVKGPSYVVLAGKASVGTFSDKGLPAIAFLLDRPCFSSSPTGSRPYAAHKLCLSRLMGAKGYYKWH